MTKAREPKRTERMDLRLSKEDRKRLDSLVRRYELSASDVIRMLIKARVGYLDRQDENAAAADDASWD